MQPMVSKMLGADGVTAGSVLLVDSVNNRTNGSLNAAEATETLRNALANNGKFTLVSAQQLSMAKQQLGLSPQDSLGTRSKAIGIARNVATALQNGNTIADGLGKTAGANGTGISSTDDNHVVRAGVKAFRQA